jgi:hypothetical protein
MELQDGGYLLLGYGMSGAFVTYLIKIDNTGSMEWAKRYQNSDHVAGSTIYQTSDNGFAITGMYRPINSGGPDDRIHLLKTDSLGNVQWSRSYISGYGVESCHMRLY